MIIEYNVVCFERTLQIKFSDKYAHLKDNILRGLDVHYTEWHLTDQDTCLEEFMIDRLCEDFGLTYQEWDSIPYGEDYEPRETLWVCEHCLMAIESREGNQATLRHSVDETDAVDSRCGWCHEIGFSTLYELI